MKKFIIGALIIAVLAGVGITWRNNTRMSGEKEEIIKIAERIGLKDVSVNIVKDQKFDDWKAIITTSNFDQFSNSQKFEIDDALSVRSIRNNLDDIINFEYRCNGSTFNVNISSIYKNGKEIYTDTFREQEYEKKENKTSSYDSSNSNNQSGRESDAWVCAQDIVRNNLKSPSSANFCSYPEAVITHTGGANYTVKGYVDAKNDFGTEVRTYFTVTLTLTDKGYKNGYVMYDK